MVNSIVEGKSFNNKANLIHAKGGRLGKGSRRVAPY